MHVRHQPPRRRPATVLPCHLALPRVPRCRAPQPRRPAAAPHLISAAPQRSCRNDFACELWKIARDGGGGDGAARELCLASSLVRKPSRMLPRCGQFNVGLLLQFGDFRRQVELGPSARRRGAFGRRVLLSRVCTSETHGPACASRAHVLVRELKQVWEHANERGADGLAGTTYDDVFDPSACTCAAASSAAGVSGAQRFLQRDQSLLQ